jgi:hypothetical protein
MYIYMIIYLILHNNIKNFCIEYCKSLHKNIKNSKIIYYPDNEINNINENNINENNLYIYFGMYYVNYTTINKENIYFINLEQLTINGKNTIYDILSPTLNIIKSYDKVKILDYSQANISILNNYNINSLYLPYQVNYDEIFNYDKIYNFAVCCALNSRIQYIYNIISSKYINCNFIGNPIKWGEERDDILFKTKVLANVHHREFDYNILEEIRITRCILNKIIVVSEYSVEWEKYPLAKYVIFIDYNNMVEKIQDVLNNYDEYFNKIYNDFDINTIDILLKKYLDYFNK